MKLPRPSLLLLFALLSACGPSAVRNPPTAEPPLNQTPIDTNICEVAQSPKSFDHKVLRLHAFLNLEFEDSSLHDPSCPHEALPNMWSSSEIQPRIWADFADEVHERVSGFAPLVEDEPLRQFRALVSERFSLHQMSGATMVGTFYAGKPIEINGHKTSLRGHGHMACCSLFVISRIESVDTNHPGLNYSSGDWNIGLSEDCYLAGFLGLPTNKTIRTWQQAANQGQEAWRYDSLRVAEGYMRDFSAGVYGQKSGGTVKLLEPKASDLKPLDDQRPTQTMLEVKSSPYLKRYEWIAPDRVTRFVVVISRPYWLEPIAGSPDKVIWIPAGASLLKCVAPGAKRKP